MKIVKASGTTINKSCMTGACEDHRKALLDANTEYWHAIDWYRQALYMSWIGFALIIGVVIIGSNW